MTSRNVLTAGRIFNIFDTISGKCCTPVSLCISIIFRNDSFINTKRFIEFTDLPEMISSVECCNPLSSLILGNVCLVPQYSQTATVVPSTTFKSPPHILHRITDITEVPFLLNKLSKIRFKKANSN